ncbi:MAG: glycosyl hydrolase family 18 protein [Myxococcota bacterium]|nr:glycosyl hydrolase family 18 protein [Myxococcota bacterium]
MIAAAIGLFVLQWGPAHASQSVHEQHARVQPRAAFPRPPSPSTGRPDITVYGYLPYWASDPLSVDLDSLSHVAWFSVDAEADGSLAGADGWTAIADDLVDAAHRVGTKVHLCVSLFDPIKQDALLNDSAARSRAVTALAGLVNAHGADGVNIDFEGMNPSSKDGLVRFTSELKAAVDEVFLALPAIDWSGAYDYDELAAASDGLFVMAYDYHWRGGDPGPVAPLTGGDPWSSYAIDWTLNDYRTWGATDDKLIVGLPLYGYAWPTDNDAIPGFATGTAEAHSLASIVDDRPLVDERYDIVTDTPWAWDGTTQLWFDDADSLEIKLSWAVAEGVQGVGFWALGYAGGDPDFWTMVDGISGARAPGPEDTGTAEAKDTAAPTDADTGITERADTGTAVDSGRSIRSPSSDGTDARRPKAGCGCHSAGLAVSGWWAMAGLFAARRRQN